MRTSLFFLVFFLALAVTQNANANQPDTVIASVVMTLCASYREDKRKYDMQCTRELTNGLKEKSEKAKKFIESADSKGICAGNENEGSLIRFDSACNVIAHLCDYMQISELKKCPEVQPLMKKTGPVWINIKKDVPRKSH